MATIVTRAGKGSPLTHDEVDDNFDNLNTDKVETSAIGTAAAADTGDFATAAQGALADTALQDITGESIENLSDVASMTPAEGQALVYGSGVWAAADMAGGIAYTRHTANVTMEANQGVIADTSGGTFTVTLPASPATGDTVVITDGGDWGTTNLTVGRNGSTIEGDAADMTMDLGGVAVQFTYDGTTWQTYAQIGAVAGLGTTRVDFVATAGQTDFSVPFTVGFIDVYLNGIKLVDGDDFTATNGTTVVLTVGAAAGDTVDTVAYSAFSVADTVSASAGGTFAGDVTFDGAFTSQGIDDNATSTAMTLDTSGNVGIGTSDPSDLTGGTNKLLIKRSDTANNYPTVYSASAGNAGWRMKNNDGDWVIMANDALRFYDIENNSEAMRIDSSGNVGIGTSSPNSPLEVNGAIVSQNTAQGAGDLQLQGYGATSYINHSGTGDLIVRMGTGYSEKMRIDASGRVTMPYQPAFRVNATYSHSLGSQWATVGYDTNLTQRGNGYNTSTSIFTAPVAGWYHFSAALTFTANTDIDGTFAISINGSHSDLINSISEPSTDGFTYNGHSVSGSAYLAANDNVRVVRYSTVTTTNRTGQTYGGWFSGYLIG